MTSAFSWQTLLAFALLHFVFQDQICLLFQVFLDFLLLHPSPHDEKHIFGRVLVLEDIVGFHRTVPLQLLQHYCLGNRLGYCDIEWFALETNRDHSAVLEMALKHCILGSKTVRANPFLLRDSCLQ